MGSIRCRMVAILMCGAAVGVQAQFTNNLMPQPAELHVGTGVLPIASTLDIVTPGARDARLQRAIDRAVHRFEARTGVAHVFPPAVGGTRLMLRVEHPGEGVQSIKEDESYALKVANNGAEIDAPTDLGAIHGLETLLQLVQPNGDGFALPVVEIHDQPRFAWRGLLIDCGRHFEPVDVIKRTLDGMAAVKLNVFHWHLTEDQGFRIESKVFPALTEKASDGQFYTQDEAHGIVAYARDRGIRVVPEFEMPGHSTALLVAYPELSSGSRPDGLRREFGVSDYALDPTREETYLFLEKFLQEMATIFPDRYIHIGGDETPAPDWNNNPRILAFKTEHGFKNNAALQAYFNTRVLAIVQRMHKRVVGWDEVLVPGLPDDVAIESWRGVASLGEGAKMGHDGILAAAPYYLDGMRPARDHYLADPSPSSANLTPAQRKHILGGEVCMWGEQVNQYSIDSRIWPRAAAIAERFWSPEVVSDVDNMYRRLHPISIELESLGLTHLSHEAVALRALVDSEDIDALRVFASAFEPVSFGERYSAQHASAVTPLDRFVDVVRPDPPTRHWCEELTERFLADPTADTTDRTALQQRFRTLANSVPTVQQQMQSAPLLRDVSVRAQQLTQLSTTASEALELLASGNRAPAGWKAVAARRSQRRRSPMLWCVLRSCRRSRSL